MVPLISLIVVMVISMMIVRVATVALTLTGISQPLARFQARSAFTGAGFTTSESERVVQHPLRRRIIMMLMLLGNAGIVSAVSSLILTFVGTQSDSGITGTIWFRILFLAFSLSLLWSFAHSEWIDRRMSILIKKGLRRFTDLEVRDYAGLLHLSGDYGVSEIQVGEKHWILDRNLGSLSLPEEGLLVLGIERRDGGYIGAPRADTQVRLEDTLIIYGRRETLANFNQREAGQKGNWDHIKAVEEQKAVEKIEKEEEEN